MSKTWKNVELTKARADHLKAFLKKGNIKYEPSGAGDLIHFEIYCDETETEEINEFLVNISELINS